MKTTFSLLTFAFSVLLFSSFASADEAGASWKRLGSKKVAYQLDRDVIRVGSNDGTFKKLKIQVSGGSLNMHKVVVEYGNGTKDVIQLKHNFKRGSNSRTIDLEGNKRIIKDITLWYDTKNLSKRRATVHVFGRK